MSSDDFIDVAAAAKQLNVNGQRVRAMLAAGQLEGVRRKGGWLVAQRSVGERLRLNTAHGRQLTPANAWFAIFLLSDQVPNVEIPVSDANRIRRLVHEKGARGLRNKLGARASVHSYYGHPGVIKRLQKEPGVVITGSNAARHYGLGLRPGQEADCYVSDADLAALIRKYGLESQPGGESNVRLREVSADKWPFKSERVAPAFAVALDLAEYADARSANIGRLFLDESGTSASDRDRQSA